MQRQQLRDWAKREMFQLTKKERNAKRLLRQKRAQEKTAKAQRNASPTRADAADAAKRKAEDQMYKLGMEIEPASVPPADLPPLEELQKLDPNVDWEKPVADVLREEYQRCYAHQNRKRRLEVQDMERLIAGPAGALYSRGQGYGGQRWSGRPFRPGGQQLVGWFPG
eukprot:TRINITY_DN32261_c0_g1_i1.p1 TRINITY_DN32261_c0_g1~~TRINITY_DN32261_c0_g1_i1.p1  ORF type:complete len:167 (+),score=24.15 TRINITY_DN32261_c0_g1_i1:125-625(+)